MKHLVDLDEEALSAARAALGTRTIKDTVNRALSEAAARPGRQGAIDQARDRLADLDVTEAG